MLISEDLSTERVRRTLAIVRKGGKHVTIPIAPRTGRALDLYIGERTMGPIFLGVEGGRVDHYRADRMVKRLVKRSLPHVRSSVTTCRMYNLQVMFGSVAWDVEYTDQFEQWWHTLTEDEQDHIAASVQLLSTHGPSLGRPAVDNISSSRHKNMKELRAGTTRTLFAFDPRRTAILLLGGDKSGEWNRWYETAVPAADDLYDEHLATIDSKGPT